MAPMGIVIVVAGLTDICALFAVRRRLDGRPLHRSNAELEPLLVVACAVVAVIAAVNWVKPIGPSMAAQVRAEMLEDTARLESTGLSKP